MDAIPTKFIALLPRLPPGHPLRALFRTYVLALSLSLGPALLSLLGSKKNVNVVRLLRRHLGPTGFPFALTLAATGCLLPQLVRRDDNRPQYRIYSTRYLYTLVTSYVAMALLQKGHRKPRAQATSDILPYTIPEDSTLTKSGLSSTWDITLIFLVRAIDSWCQRIVSRRQQVEEKNTDVQSQEVVSGRVDAAMFWAASSRIMWCFFYQPQSLPPSYLKWISALANLDQRLIQALRDIRTGAFSYSKGVTPPGLLTSMASDMGCSPAWGDPKQLSATGGPSVGEVYSAIGSRRGVGGIPCELVHGHVDQKSCVANAARRGATAFLKALMIYSPIHFLSTALAHPKQLLNVTKLLTKSLAVLRSSLFLSTFVGSIWMAVCLVRTLAIARIFPNISHDIYDGPYGCVMAGCLVCGSSIFIEEPKRRSEMALYVLPRALRSCLPEVWMRRHGHSAKIIERIVFAVSITSLLTTHQFRPDTLRGLSKWTLAYVMKGNMQDTPPPATRHRNVDSTMPDM